MQSLSELGTNTACWIQPRTGQRLYELQAEGTCFGTLSFRSHCGTLAVADLADGSWTFKRVGFLNPRITVRTAGDDADLMVYQPRIWGDGTLKLRDGQSIHWTPTDSWRTAWAFVDSQNALLVRITQGVADQKLTDLFKTQMTVEIPQSEIENLALLVPLAMYLLILQQDDTAAAVAATGAATG